MGPWGKITVVHTRLIHISAQDTRTHKTECRNQRTGAQEQAGPHAKTAAPPKKKQAHTFSWGSTSGRQREHKESTTMQHVHATPAKRERQSNTAARALHPQNNQQVRQNTKHTNVRSLRVPSMGARKTDNAHTQSWCVLVYPRRGGGGGGGCQGWPARLGEIFQRFNRPPPISLQSTPFRLNLPPDTRKTKMASGKSIW